MGFSKSKFGKIGSSLILCGTTSLGVALNSSVGIHADFLSDVLNFLKWLTPNIVLKWFGVKIDVQKIETLNDDFMNIFCKTEEEEEKNRLPYPEPKEGSNGMSFLVNLIYNIGCQNGGYEKKVKVKKDRLIDLCAFENSGSWKKFRDFCKNDENNEIVLESIAKEELTSGMGLKLWFCYYPKGTKGVSKESVMIKNDMNSLFTLYDFYFGKEPVIVNKSGTKVKLEKKENSFTVTRYDNGSETLVFTFDPKKNYGNPYVFWKALTAEKIESKTSAGNVLCLDENLDSGSFPVNFIIGKEEERSRLRGFLDSYIAVLYEGKLDIPRKLRLKAKNLNEFLDYEGAKDEDLKREVSSKLQLLSSLDGETLLDVEFVKITNSNTGRGKFFISSNGVKLFEIDDARFSLNMETKNKDELCRVVNQAVDYSKKEGKIKFKSRFRRSEPKIYVKKGENENLFFEVESKEKGNDPKLFSFDLTIKSNYDRWSQDVETPLQEYFLSEEKNLKVAPNNDVNSN